jgi:hypothetical protein
MSEDTYIAAHEAKRHWTDEQNGVRVFRMTDEPVQMKIEKREDGSYELVCRKAS